MARPARQSTVPCTTDHLRPQLRDVLAKDHFDVESDKEHTAKGELLTPFDPSAGYQHYMTPSPDLNEEPQHCSTPSPIQCATYWDVPLPSYKPPT